MFENPRRGRQARNFTTNVPKILDLKSSSEQIFFRKLSLGAPVEEMQRGKTLQIDGAEKYTSARQACHYAKSKKHKIEKTDISCFGGRHKSLHKYTTKRGH